jgi:hypothetical protein
MTASSNHRHRHRQVTIIALAFALGAFACRPGPGSESASERRSVETYAGAELIMAVAATLEQSMALADSVEELLRPVPLLRPDQEAALRRYSNAANVERARALGVRPADSTELASLIEQGRLVPLEGDARFWVLRELDDSRPYVTPDTRALLERIGRDFQRRLTEMGLPAFRLEISSVLRTAEDQAALRRENPNAAAGTSAHEFGTTVDIAYSGYAAPVGLPEELVATAPVELRVHLEVMARRVMERVAARKSRELEAVLGGVLREVQSEGDVMVTLERLQPVYHITVARRLSE